MKKIFVIAMGLTVFNIHAAEDWKGCYFGASASYADAANQWQTLFFQGDAENENAGSAEGDDTAIGAHFGCDFYEDEEWVFGAKIAATDNSMTASHLYVGGTGPDNFISYKTDDMVSIIGRIGFKAWDNGLIYANVGYTEASSQYNDDDPSPPVIAFQKNTKRDGLTLGMGYEHMISDRFSVFAEYNQTDFGKKTVLLNDNANFGVDDYQARIDQDIDQFSLGINFNF